MIFFNTNSQETYEKMLNTTYYPKQIIKTIKYRFSFETGKDEKE